MAPGDVVTLETRDGLDGQLTRASTHADCGRFDDGRAHPLTGPVFVDGAEPGDVLEVELVDFETPAFGVNCVIPGFGFLADVFTEPFLVPWELDGAVARSPELPGIAVPACVHAGVIGVAPSHALMEAQREREERIRAAGGPVADDAPTSASPPSAAGGLRTIPPRETGGNLDIRRLVAGSTLLLPVHVPGALLSLGDVHFAQGDGEVCGTGIEIEAAVTVRLGLRKAPRWVPRFPAYVTPRAAGARVLRDDGDPGGERDGPHGRCPCGAPRDDRLARDGARALPPGGLLPVLGMRRSPPLRRSSTSRTRSSPHSSRSTSSKGLPTCRRTCDRWPGRRRCGRDRRLLGNRRSRRRPAPRGAARTSRVADLSASDPVDVTDRGALDRLAHEVAQARGRLDVLVNAAGILTPNLPADELPVEDFVRAYEVNVLGTVNACQAFFPLLRASRGAIVNVASQAALVSLPHQAAYTAAKGAVAALTRSLAIDWAEHGIRANAVAPGFTLTPMTEAFFENEIVHNGRDRPDPARADPLRRGGRGRDRLPCEPARERRHRRDASGGRRSGPPASRHCPGRPNRLASRRPRSPRSRSPARGARAR